MSELIMGQSKHKRDQRYPLENLEKGQAYEFARLLDSAQTEVNSLPLSAYKSDQPTINELSSTSGEKSNTVQDNTGPLICSVIGDTGKHDQPFTSISNTALIKAIVNGYTVSALVDTGSALNLIKSLSTNLRVSLAILPIPSFDIAL
ncbi:hypothetical protein GJ496_011173 [Pomphorhynchus laevis]|nr:hypothetical protein GJ496_011173 [Pomphorhynchus laevis]